MAGMCGSPGTEKLSTMELTAAAEATTVLTETAAETTVLQQPEEVGATTVLSEEEREPAEVGGEARIPYGCGDGL